MRLHTLRPGLAGMLIGVIWGFAGGFPIGWVYNRLGGLGVSESARWAAPIGEEPPCGNNPSEGPPAASAPLLPGDRNCGARS